MSVVFESNDDRKDGVTRIQVAVRIAAGVDDGD